MFRIRAQITFIDQIYKIWNENWPFYKISCKGWDRYSNRNFSREKGMCSRRKMCAYDYHSEHKTWFFRTFTIERLNKWEGGPYYMVKRSFKVSLRDGSASLRTWMEIFSKLLSSEKPKYILVQRRPQQLTISNICIRESSASCKSSWELTYKSHLIIWNKFRQISMNFQISYIALNLA